MGGIHEIRFEMDSGVTIYIPVFINFVSAIQKFEGGIHSIAIA
jgi:hypothetical protein